MRTPNEEILIFMLRELLLGGEHDGECDNLPDYEEACSLHLATYCLRKNLAKSFLDSLDKEEAE